MTLRGKNGNYLLSLEKPNVLRPNGRFSLIFKGKDERTGKDVIVKQLHPRLENSSVEIKRFSEEFANDPQLKFIPTTLDFIQTEGHHYIIREYFEGTDFKDFMDGKGKKINSRKEKLDIFTQLLENVRSLHESGFIHADLKPSNFIIGKSASGLIEVKLIDLGLAFQKQNKNQMVRNEKSALPFSFHYSSPELMLNFPELVNEQSDIFSMGMILYEWMNGELPWKTSIRQL